MNNQQNELRDKLLALPRPGVMSYGDTLEVYTSDIECLIDEQMRLAYKKGYIDSGIATLTQERQALLQSTEGEQL